MGRITQVTTKQNAAAASVTLASAIAYQPLSRLVQAMAYGNGLSDFNTHTLDYELDVLGVYNGATSVINRAHTRADRLNLTNIFDNVAAANTQVCAYGPANRLQNADGPWGKRTFYYDGVGNRTTEIATPPASTVATTDTLGYAPTNNRVSQIVRGGSTVRSFTYDGAGNLLTDNGLGGNKTYTYNRRNRLSDATVGALTYGYTYNAMEQLAIRQATNATPVTTSHFIHDIFGNVIAETAGGGATGATGTVREYIWLPETEIAPTMASRTQVDRPLAVVDAVNGATPATWWVSVDHLNRPVRMTTSTKASVWDAVWLPWGGIHAITGSASLDARFPGQWFQLETGLHYNWHRSYDPTIGRYTQPDPLGFVDGPSVYGYAGGSPGMAVDPDGRAIPVYIIRILLGAAAGGGGNLAAQLYLHGGRLECVNGLQVAKAAAFGAAALFATGLSRERLRDFFKDNSGGKGRKRDLDQVDDAFKQAARDENVTPNPVDRKDFKDVIHNEKGSGPDFPYRDLF